MCYLAWSMQQRFCSQCMSPPQRMSQLLQTFRSSEPCSRTSGDWGEKETESIDHFTVACSVTWLLNRSEVGGDLVLGHLQPRLHSEARYLRKELQSSMWIESCTAKHAILNQQSLKSSGNMECLSNCLVLLAYLVNIPPRNIYHSPTLEHVFERLL